MALIYKQRAEVMYVPNHLKKYAYDVNTSQDTVSFRLKCNCGCKDFDLLKNTYTAEEERSVHAYEKSLPKTGWHAVYGGIDANGNRYTYIKILGLFKKHVRFPEAPYFVGIEVMKAVCKNCKKEIILFDNRMHGSSSVKGISEDKMNYLPYFDDGKKKPGKVIVVLDCDEAEEADPNMFTRIRVYSITDQRKSLFYEQETD